MRIRVVLVVAVVVGLLAAACGDDGGADAAAGSGGAALLDTVVVTFDGADVTVGELTDGPTVVNFFAESCPPCVAEMPAFESVHQELGDAVTFVGISEDATPDDAIELVDTTGVTYTTVWDRDGTAITAVETLGMPTTALVDADGTLVTTHTGALTADGLRDLLTEHFPDAVAALG